MNVGFLAHRPCRGCTLRGGGGGGGGGQVDPGYVATVS